MAAGMLIEAGINHERFPRNAQAAVAGLRGVTKQYGETKALNNLSLQLYPGEVVALLGPNGAGKTTAVRLLLGLISPNAARRAFSGATHAILHRGRGLERCCRFRACPSP